MKINTDFNSSEVPEQFRITIDAAVSTATLALELAAGTNAEILPAFCFVIDKDGKKSLANLDEFMTPEFSPLRRGLFQTIIKERNAQIFCFMSEGWMVEADKNTDIDALMERNQGSLANDDRRVSCLNIHAESADGGYCSVMFRINEKAKPRTIDWAKPDLLQSGNYGDGNFPVDKLTRAMDLFDTQAKRRAA